MMTDAERCLREWAEQRAGPGTTHWEDCGVVHPACAALAALRELDAVRRENEELRAELEDARWLIEDLQLDLRALSRHVDAGGTTMDLERDAERERESRTLAAAPRERQQREA